VANPLATFLSVAMLLRDGLGLEAEAARVEVAVDAALQAGLRTADLATGAASEKAANTAEMTEAVLGAL
jgi:3-isopropylmalate dehydrogenase